MSLNRVPRLVVGALLAPLVSMSLVLLWWDGRSPPAYEYDAVLRLEHWTVVTSEDPARQHNSNTDMVWFRNAFYLIHAQTKWHLEDPNGALVIWTSPDAVQWREVARISVPETDVRDPKFAVIDDRLFLYFLPNYFFDPFPETTLWTVSDDGVSWQEPQELDTFTTRYVQDGVEKTRTGDPFRVWRPKSLDGETWYMVAFGNKPTAPWPVSILVKSMDGIHWEEVSEVYGTHGTWEPTMEFLPDRSIIATMRIHDMGTPGYTLGNATGNTGIGFSRPPYREWSMAHDFQTRLDGATTFSIDGRIFTVGRNHLGPTSDMGNHLGRKRTAFYEVRRDRLVHLFDLPSNGDTAYTGVVIRGDDIYVSYYTSPIEKDYPWLMGVALRTRTDVRIARVSATGLVEFADAVLSRKHEGVKVTRG
jgi:hypothetical protein